MRSALSGGRRDYWLPLALTGFALLIVLALQHAGSETRTLEARPLETRTLDERSLAVAYFEAGDSRSWPVQQGLYGVGDAPFPSRSEVELAPFGLLGIFLLTVAWYVLRAHRAGATPSFRRVAGVVLGGTAAVFVLSAFGEASWRGVGESGFLTNIVLPLGGLGLCGMAWARFGRGEFRKAGGWAGAVLLALVGSLLLAVVLPERDGLLAILVGLLVLAWLERAWQPAALAVPLALATFDFVPGPPGLVPAMVLLAGALVTLVTRFSPTGDPA